MLVPQEQAERLVELVLTLVKKVAIKAHSYLFHQIRDHPLKRY